MASANPSAQTNSMAGEVMRYFQHRVDTRVRGLKDASWETQAGNDVTATRRNPPLGSLLSLIVI
jgi:hypothetical protein